MYIFIANLWTPYTKRSAGGNIYLSQNFMCFKSDVQNLVSLVIPLRVIHLVEKKVDGPASRFDHQIIVTTASTTFQFSQVLDREFFLKKSSELLAKFKVYV